MVASETQTLVDRVARCIRVLSTKYDYDGEGVLCQVWMPEDPDEDATHTKSLSTRNLPFAVVGRGDLLALFRCVSCRYRFGINDDKQLPLGLVGRVYATARPLVCVDVQQYEQETYLRVKEARRCSVFGTVLLPIMASRPYGRPSGVLEMALTSQNVDYEVLQERLNSVLNDNSLYTCVPTGLSEISDSKLFGAVAMSKSQVEGVNTCKTPKEIQSSIKHIKSEKSELVSNKMPEGSKQLNRQSQSGSQTPTQGLLDEQVMSSQGASVISFENDKQSVDVMNVIQEQESQLRRSMVEEDCCSKLVVGNDQQNKSKVSHSERNADESRNNGSIKIEKDCADVQSGAVDRSDKPEESAANVPDMGFQHLDQIISAPYICDSLDMALASEEHDHDLRLIGEQFSLKISALEEETSARGCSKHASECFGDARGESRQHGVFSAQKALQQTGTQLPVQSGMGKHRQIKSVNENMCSISEVLDDDQNPNAQLGSGTGKHGVEATAQHNSAGDVACSMPDQVYDGNAQISAPLARMTAPDTALQPWTQSAIPVEHGQAEVCNAECVAHPVMMPYNPLMCGPSQVPYYVHSYGHHQHMFKHATVHGGCNAMMCLQNAAQIGGYDGGVMHGPYMAPSHISRNGSFGPHNAQAPVHGVPWNSVVPAAGNSSVHTPGMVTDPTGFNQGATALLDQNQSTPLPSTDPASAFVPVMPLQGSFTASDGRVDDVDNMLIDARSEQPSLTPARMPLHKSMSTASFPVSKPTKTNAQEHVMQLVFAIQAGDTSKGAAGLAPGPELSTMLRLVQDAANSIGMDIKKVTQQHAPMLETALNKLLAQAAAGANMLAQQKNAGGGSGSKPTAATSNGVASVTAAAFSSDVDFKCQQGVGKRLTYKDLEPQFGLGLKDAAARLHVCPTTLKRACRRIGISQWPRRQLEKLNKQFESMHQSEVEKLVNKPSS